MKRFIALYFIKYICKLLYFFILIEISKNLKKENYKTSQFIYIIYIYKKIYIYINFFHNFYIIFIYFSILYIKFWNQTENKFIL